MSPTCPIVLPAVEVTVASPGVSVDSTERRRTKRSCGRSPASRQRLSSWATGRSGGSEALARKLGVADRLDITGWTSDPGSHLSRFTVFCLPSRSGTESFPLSIVEAMLAELPVVATAVGSVTEAVRDGETGLIVPVDDPEALRRALRLLLDDPGLRQEMGRRGRRRALERFTAERMVAGFEELYREVLA